jgi:hypothetical protein
MSASASRIRPNCTSALANTSRSGRRRALGQVHSSFPECAAWAGRAAGSPAAQGVPGPRHRVARRFSRGLGAQAHGIGQTRGLLRLVGDEGIQGLRGPPRLGTGSPSPAAHRARWAWPIGEIRLADARVGGLAQQRPSRTRNRPAWSAACDGAATRPGRDRARPTRPPLAGSLCRPAVADRHQRGHRNRVTDHAASRSTARASVAGRRCAPASTAARSRLSNRPDNDPAARCQLRWLAVAAPAGARSSRIPDRPGQRTRSISSVTSSDR